MFSKPIRACLKLAAVIGPRVPDMRGKTVSSLSGAPHSCGDLQPHPDPGSRHGPAAGYGPRARRTRHRAARPTAWAGCEPRTPHPFPFLLVTITMPMRPPRAASDAAGQNAAPEKRLARALWPRPLPSPRRGGLLASGKDGMIRLPTSVPARRPLRVRHIQGTRRAFRLLFGKQPGWTRRAFQAMFSPASPRGLFLSVRETSRKAPRLVSFPTFTASS